MQFFLMRIQSSLMTILVMSHFLMMKWVFLVLSTELNNINLDDDSENDSETFIHVTTIAQCNKHRQRNTFKKQIHRELMLVLWHWWNWCMSKNEKNQNVKPFTYDEKQYTFGGIVLPKLVCL